MPITNTKRCALLALIFMGATGNCFAKDDAFVVTSEQLNMRGGPYSNAPILKKLNRGDEVSTTGEKAAEWWKIRSFTGGEPNFGWVNSTFLQPKGVPLPQTITNGVSGESDPSKPAPVRSPATPVVPSVPTPTNSALQPTINALPGTAAPAEVPTRPAYPSLPPAYYPRPLRVADASFKCTNNIITEGIDRCTIDINISYNGDHDVSGHFGVDCEVTAIFEEKDSLFPSKKQYDDHTSMYVSYGYGSASMTIYMRPPFGLEPFIRAKVRDLECRYTHY